MDDECMGVRGGQGRSSSELLQSVRLLAWIAIGWLVAAQVFGVVDAL